MQPKSIATLLVLRSNDEVLFGIKKSGEIGAGLLNMPGGKWEEHETILACVARETNEEVGVTVREQDLQHIGILDCYAAKEWYQRVHLYYTETFSGTPVETDSMVPEWIKLAWLSLSYNRMHGGDRHWIGLAVRGKRFRCSIWYEHPGKGYIEHELSGY